MRILIVTDAWHPQVNGVVRTLTTTCDHLRALGHAVEVVSPDLFRSLPCPSYPEIRLALAGRRAVGRWIEAFAPDAVHIATEGPLGWVARAHCRRAGRAFTTAYHTQFPQYVARRTHLPESWFWPVIRRFHRPAAGVMVATASVRAQLRAHGFERLREWSRGVDLAQFTPDIPPPDLFLGLPRPIMLYVGRVAVEKNIEAFLSTEGPGSKVVVGDGPARAALEAAYPDAHFLGSQQGRALAACYAGADVFVFPSRTDTFGLVMIEALACGTPVAAFPVAGPRDIVDESSGALDDDLGAAIERALTRDRAGCVARGRQFSWARSTAQFLAALACNGEPTAARGDLPAGGRTPVAIG